MSKTNRLKHLGNRLVAVLLSIVLIAPLLGNFAPVEVQAATVGIGDMDNFTEDGNILLFNTGEKQVMVELCTDRTVRVQLSENGADGYRPANAEYYMVQKNEWPAVNRSVTQENGVISVKTAAMEVRINQSPLRIGMYDLEGKLLSKDTEDTGMYVDGDKVGVKKTEGTENAGGIFGFGSGDHGRRSNLNRYATDFNEFSMSHGRLIAPFFMSTVGYGVFLNTIEKDTVFYKQGGGFQTKGYLDYFFMYGPDFKTILNEYAEITGRMEMYGKWAHGFMLSKYGNDNATQAEFSQWIHRLRDEGYPTDSYVFDYGWRGDVADNGGNQTGAGEKWGKQMWSNDIVKFPDIDGMFQEARDMGIRVGLHNNAGTPEAKGGKNLHINDDEWVQSYMDSVITTGYGDWFWPDEFDVLGSNTAPTFSSLGAYEAWKAYTEESRPMFVTRGSYAGQHFATAWSGDINNTSSELVNQIGFSIDAGLVGYWSTSHDLGGFMKKPSDKLYTRWVSEFGAWNGIMRAHGHDGREPWLYSETSQNTLKKNLEIRYALYPYLYTMAWQGYSEGVPMMRAMLLEDDSQYNPDAWNLNKQYYFGDWFLVAPAAEETDTVVQVWLPPNTTWYEYYSGERYEGGENGKTINVAAALEEIPVFVKAGAIVPMGPDVDYADEKPLDPLTLDIYPKGTTTYTLYEDDGQSREYITKDAYSTTTYTSVQEGNNISFRIDERTDHNPAEYKTDERSYNLKFNHLKAVRGVTLNNENLPVQNSLEAYNAAQKGFWLDDTNNTLYVKVTDTGKAMNIVLDSDGLVLPEEGEDNQGLPPQRVESGTLVELEDQTFLPVAGGQVIKDTEWKGYTGNGFVKGFKMVGDAVEFRANVVKGGTYDLTIRVNCGKKNSAQFDNTPRTGALYLNGEKKSDLAFEVTPTWGDSKTKQGDWREYKIAGVKLSSGVQTLQIRSEGSNAGNYNLDSLKFTRLDTSIPAFQPIKAEKNSHLDNMTLETGGEVPVIKAVTDGAWAQFDEVTGENKAGVELKLKSTTGGSIIVYENGVGDKILATAALPNDGEWHTIRVAGKNTDVPESNIFLEFKAPQGKALDCEMEWFRFMRNADAFNTVKAVTAAERNGINVHSSGAYLVNIESGDWARFDDVNFGDGGVQTAAINVTSGRPGGTAQFYIDSMEEENKIAEVEITNTGGWSNFKDFTADCANVTGIHTVYVKFSVDTKDSVCDFMSFKFMKNKLGVVARVEGGNATVQISEPYTAPGQDVMFQVGGLDKSTEIEAIEVTDANGAVVPLQEVVAGSRYTLTVPQAIPATVLVKLRNKPTVINPGDVFELEDGKGITNDSNTALRTDTEWKGYTGRGYVAGFKTEGQYVEILADVKAAGIYDLEIHVNNGKKNSPQYDSTPRTGGLYVNGEKAADLAFPVTDTWGDSSKNGDWRITQVQGIALKAGIQTIRIRAEGSNAGNYNLDSVKFVLTQPEVEKYTITYTAETGGSIDGTAVQEVEAGSNTTAVTAIADSGYEFAQWSDGNVNAQRFETNVQASQTLTASFRVVVKDVTITARSEDEATGSVSGGGTVKEGEKVTLTAMAHEGYSFEGWYLEGVKVSDASVYEVEAAEDAEYLAKFIKNAPVKVTITVQSEDEMAGTVSGGGSVNLGETVTITATAREGYTFEGWYLGETKVSDQAEYEAEATEDAAYTARFTKNAIQQVTITAKAEEGGTAEGTARVDVGTKVTLTATANEGYVFEGWYLDNVNVSKNAEYEVEARQDATYVARFTKEEEPQPETVNITVEAQPGGTVSDSGTVTKGELFTITAYPEDGYRFTGWYLEGEKVSDDLSLEVMAVEDAVYTAYFEEKPKEMITIQVVAETGGRVSGGVTAEYGTTVKIQAFAQEGYVFEGWYIGSLKVSSNPEYTMNALQNTVYTAKFVQKEAPKPQKVTVTVKVETGGTAAGGQIVDAGSKVSLTAKPSSKYTFDGWYLNGKKVSTSVNYTVAVYQNVTYTAKFKKITAPKKATGLKASNLKINQMKLSWNKINGAKGYELSRYNPDKNKWYVVKTTGQTSYRVKGLSTGTIYKYRVRAYTLSGSKKIFGEYSKYLKTATTPRQPALTAKVSSTTSVKLSWKKGTKADGFAIYMKTGNGKFTRIKNASAASTAYTKTKLKKGKVYQFKMRGYKKAGETKIYGNYSKVRTIKLK